MRSRFHRSPALAMLAVLVATAAAHAEVTLAPLFTDHAVLQRDRVVPVWGRASVGEKVTVTFGGQKREATPAADGRWIALLEAMPATTQGADLVVTGSNTLTVHDVVVGEVWLCSGQSNMEFSVEARAGTWQTRARALNADAEIATANFPLIRHVRIEQRVAETPADTVPTSGWQAATPQTVGGFTAVGYFFARDIHQKLGVPIGIVHSSWGGTPVESWMSPAALASDPAFRVAKERWAQTVADYPAAKAAYDARLAEWTQAEATARNTLAMRPASPPVPATKIGPATKTAPAPKATAAAAAKGKTASKAGAVPATPAPATYADWLRQNPRPRAPRGPGDPWTPTSLFNGMINPLLPYALRGVLWYQGESNAERASEYHALFAAMITAWRGHFGQGDLPFFWVNLANYEVPVDPTHRTYAFLREAQTQTLALPNTGQALAIDIGDPRDIHPTNKQEVGRRLALLARNRVYNMTIDDTGPTLESATREGPALRLRFSHAIGGLMAHGKPVQSLEIAGADRVFQPADGRIDHDTLFVSSSKVREPVAVRYAWSNAPEANLYNGAGLPAVPFRTDAW